MGFIASAIGGLASASAAKKAAKAQSKAADKQLALQREIYEDTTQNFSGYRDAGKLALQAYMYEMGLGPAPTVGGRAQAIETIPGTTTTTPSTARQVPGFGGALGFQAYYKDGNNTQTNTTPTTYRVGGNTFTTLEEAQAWANANKVGGQAYGGFTATPGYQFRFDQGTDAVNALAGARGGLVSGRTMQDLTKFGQGIASEEHGNYMNRLAGLTDMGMGAAGNQATAGNAFASGASNALAAKGNAAAAGAVGVGNAINGAINNGLSIWQYQQGLDPMAGALRSAGVSGVRNAGW